VAWMLERETNPDAGGMPPFWTQATEKMNGRNTACFFNTITSSSTVHQPVSVGNPPCEC
jgi:hypothetical protein